MELETVNRPARTPQIFNGNRMDSQLLASNVTLSFNACRSAAALSPWEKMPQPWWLVFIMFSIASRLEP